MQRRRVLVLAFFPAFDPPSSGGEIRLLEIWRNVARFHDVTLLSSTHMHAELSTVHHGSSFVEIRVPKEEHSGAIWDELKTLAPGAEVSPLGVALGGGRFSDLHKAYLDHYDWADIIVHTFPFTIDYDLFLGLDGKPRVYESHNAEYRLAPAIYPGAKADVISGYIAALEHRLIESADLVTVCSDADRTAFEELAPDMPARLVIVPNGVTPLEAPQSRRADQPQRVIFVGSAHRPNKIAAELIVAEIAPALPELTFDIVGGCLDESTPLPANVTRHGLVSHERKAELLETADIALNPVVEGSGSNLKVAEYLSLGIPLISTAFGVRGFDMKPHVHYISSSLDRFADILGGANANWSRFQTVGEAGRVHIEQNFSWSKIADQFAAELAALKINRPGPFGSGIMLVLNDYSIGHSTGGGSTRIRGLYGAIAGKMPVVFLTFWDGAGTRISRFSDNMLEISVAKSDAHKDEQVRSDAKHHASSADIINFIHAPLNPALVALYKHLRAFAWRISVEHVYMVGLPQMFGDLFIHSSHNHELKLKQGILDGHPDAASLLRHVANAEAYAVEAASLLLSVSRDDLTALSRGRRAFPPTIVIPNGVLTPSSIDDHTVDLPHTMGARPVVFLGSGHLPNVEAARFVAEHVAPACAAATFHFIGSVCESLADLAGPNIVLWGMVDEQIKSRILNACLLALNPVIGGGGSNVKFADYLAHGLPVLTTPFGLRGIDGATDHVLVAARPDFTDTLTGFLDGSVSVSSTRPERLAFFEDSLSLEKGGVRFLSALEDMSRRRKRVLFAAYRYGDPPQGGAEAHMLKFVEALAADGGFDIDIISPDIESIDSASRFRSIYRPSPDAALPVDLPRVTVARFPVDDRMATEASPAAAAIWEVEPAFERAWMEPLVPGLSQPRLLWGWSSPERHGDEVIIRALQEAALFVPLGAQAAIRLRASPAPEVEVEVLTGGQSRKRVIKGEEEIALPESGGIIILRTTPSQLTPADPRRSDFVLTGFESAGQVIDLNEAKLAADELLEGEALADALSSAADATRFNACVALSDARGPHSHTYADWLATNVYAYDLIIAHNAVFWPTIAAIGEAKAAGVPSVLIAQVHLDDDFYHFPDVESAVRNASISFVAPLQAAAHYQQRGIETAQHLGAGVDLDETYTEDDRAAFRAIHADQTPFVLVLGRKSRSKNYTAVVDAVAHMSETRAIRTVLIGIDEDGELMQHASATYLGEQPRSVVRGALMSCMALVNMGRSESFGMVVLEAWAAGVPVVANQASSAFCDLIQHEQNGLLASPSTLADAISRVFDDGELVTRLVDAGRASLAPHGWPAVCARFVQTCRTLAG